jgi:NTP pyrophosphatase (non-canonical NTP hydrolase)
MLNELSKDIYENAVARGWWDEKRSFGDIVALCHSELSEALEEYRNGKNLYYCQAHKGNLACIEGNNGNLDNDACLECLYIKATDKLSYQLKPEGLAIELADCMIRIMDYCGGAGIDIEKAIKIKHEYNKTRPFKHGGKKM